jgi:hypothetical protein
VNVTANGIAAALLRKRTGLHFSYSLSFLSFNGLHFHPFVLFQKPNPKNELFVGFVTFVFVALTFRNSFLSSQLVTDFITLSAAFSLLTNMLQSSAYLAKCSPLLSSSWSNLSR